MTESEYMLFALEEAQKAKEEGEIPIGAILVYKDMVIAAGHNRKETEKDPTAHAEILALRKGARILGRWRLTGASLYVTIEPCPMCAGALLNARISRLVYGAANPQYGAIESRFRITGEGVLNHTMEITSGIRQKECQALMDSFFARKR